MEHGPNNDHKDPITGSEIYDIPRQHSRCKVLIYSHIDDNELQGRIDCSLDVIQCETSKSIKSGGGAAIVLVPRRNYLNYVFPNDYVHIYFDPGDGRGFIRTFFGFVDRIERTIQTSGSGVTSTRFQITCSDFTKALDKTQVYFNPHLVSRGDFVSQFAGTEQIGGVALMSKGIQVWGTPADVVISLVQHLLGFNTQFKVPKSHPSIGAVVEGSRRSRLKNALVPLMGEILQLKNPETIKAIKDKTDKEKAALVNESTNKLLDALPKVIDDRNVVATRDYLGDLISSQTGLEYNAYALQKAIQAGRRIYGSGEELSLLDLIDFSFIEYGAIDGSILAPSIWQSQGSLWSIMNTWSNDLVNELFCDLRPVGLNNKFDQQKGGYSSSYDENNVLGCGIRMIPAVVMREYPFSTVESIKSAGEIVFNDKSKKGTDRFPITGIGADGGIFSQEPGKSGRKVVRIDSLNPFRRDKKATKHLDVLAISVQDIVSERIGRGDADTFNLIEVMADLGIGKHGKYMSIDVQPIANPISIIRDGLRPKTYVSRYARWPAKLAKDAGLDNALSRLQTTRWALMLDHWYQHNKEYLNGTFNLRAFPELRVGYRLDIKERSESYYVEGVNHAWSYSEQGALLQTTATVSRGQRNDPYPVYVLPPLPKFGGTAARNAESRLAHFFRQVDPHDIRAALIEFGNAQDYNSETSENSADIPGNYKKTWGGRPWEFLAAGASPVTTDETLEKMERYRNILIYAAVEEDPPADLTGGKGKPI